MPQHACPRHRPLTGATAPAAALVASPPDSVLLTALACLAVVAETTDPDRLRGLVAAQTVGLEPLARVMSAIRTAQKGAGSGDGGESSDGPGAAVADT